MTLQPLTVLMIVAGTVLLLIGCFLLLRSMPTTTPATQVPITRVVTYPPNFDQTPSTYRPTITPTKTRTDALDDQNKPPNLIIGPPTCYELPQRQQMCMGRVFNRSDDQAVQHVQLSARNHASDTKTPIALEQYRIPPQGSAPYRFFATSSQPDPSQAILQIERWEASNTKPQLSITDEHGELLRSALGDVRYRIDAAIYNPSQKPTRGVRIITTLLDGDDAVIGYRVVAWPDGLAADESRKFHLTLVPQITAQDVHHTLAIETLP